MQSAGVGEGGVELARMVCELRADGRRLDAERRAAVQQLSTTQQRLTDAQHRLDSLQAQALVMHTQSL